MIREQNLYRPLTETDLELAPLEIGEEAADLVYWSFREGEAYEARMASLLDKHFPKIRRDQMTHMCTLDNREACWELVRWVAFALVLDGGESKG